MSGLGVERIDNGLYTSYMYKCIRVLRNAKQCAICSDSVGRLLVDHCHVKQVIRGVICYICNTRLGILEDRLRKRIPTDDQTRWLATFSLQIQKHLRSNLGPYPPGITNRKSAEKQAYNLRVQRFKRT